MPVAVIVHKAAAGAPVLRMAPKTGGLGHIREGAIAVVAIQNILPKTGAENIVNAIVVIVADANAARPANRMQSRFFRNIGESAISVVLIETIARALGCVVHARARQNENVHPTVVVVVNEGAASVRRAKVRRPNSTAKTCGAKCSRTDTLPEILASAKQNRTASRL